MKKILLLTILINALSNSAIAQKATIDNYEGQWSNNNSWTDNNAPALTIVDNIDYIINGYISVGEYSADGSLDQDLYLPPTGEDDFFTIRDTLAVYGNVTIDNKGHRVVIESGGLLIVFGDYSANNKIDVSNGGKLVVTGLTTINGGQSNYSGTGELYALGGISGNNTDAQTAAADSDFSTEDSSLRNFVNNGGVSSLPIELKSFKASKSGQNISLDWVTAKEENFSHFEIERSIDQNNWEQIGMVQGLGESNSDVNYDFTDRGAPFGVIYYRLKSVDIDATFEYSPVVEIEIGFEGKLAVSPNPVKDASNLKIRVPSEFRDDLAYVGLFDLSGIRVQEFRNFNTDGSLQINQKLKSGMYILKVNHNGLQENIRVIVQ